MTTVYNPYEDWGYKFTGKAIDSFIRDIEGEAALNKYPEFCDRRNRAEQLMFDLFGQTPYLFYVRRIEQGHNLGEQKWELTLATDFDNLELPTQLEERGSTLKLVAIVNNDGSGGLRIIYARLRSKREGTKDSFAKSFYLRLRSSYQYHIGVPPLAIERMADTPFKQDCIPTEQQLEAWKAFTKVEERIAKEKQFCVPFVSHNYGEATRNITFAIDAESATVDSQAENSITLDDFWRRAKRARNQNIKLRENNSSNSDGRELGTIELIDYENNFLKISLDDEIFDLLAEEHYIVPQEGLLAFEAVGDLAQINRKKRALKDLEKGKTQNPYLGQFLFDASEAREVGETVQIQSQDLLLQNTNSSQKAAVETVMSASDLALIQGPPGTGKTTVIAEICYQVALRGGRTLIASQANLAVDNALSRLQHNPAIRAVRKGNKNSVGLEGEPFLEDNVIKTWLQNTSADCEQRLNTKLELAKILRQLLASVEQFSAYLITEEKFQPKQKQLIAHQKILEASYQNQFKAYEIAQGKQDQLKSLSNNLTDIVTSTSSINWDKPTVFGCLTKLTSYPNRDDSVEQLAINVRKATILAKEIGLFLPEFDLFALAGWLHDNLPLKLAEAHLVLNRAKYIQIESSFDSEQKLLQERKVIIKSDYQAKTESYKEAEQKEREVKVLKTDLETLLAKASGVNWYEPEVIGLLARLQPYIDKETSARGLTENILNEIREIAIEFGILLPEYQLLGLVGLHNAIPTQLPSIKTALSYAQNAASAMDKVNYADQTLMKNKNLIAQLEEEKSKIPQKQIEFQKELNSLNLQKSKIDVATADLQKWSGTAYLNLYEAIERCFKQRQNLTEYSLQLPLHLVESVNLNRPNNSKFWETCLRSGNNKLSKLIAHNREWEEVLKIFRSIDSMIQEGKNLVNVDHQTLSNNTVHEFFDAIAEELNSLNPLQAIKKLQNRTQTTLVQIQQKLGTWNQHWQFINYQKRRVLLRTELRATAWHCNAIIKQNKPEETEQIFKQIAHETINGILNSSQQLSDRTNEEIDRKIRQIQARLNELEDDELRISRQISFAQESVEKSRNEGKYNFSQILTLLRQMNKSSILPEPLRSIAEQVLQHSDVRRLAPQFLGQVNYYQNRFAQLEISIPKLNPFSILSKIDNLIAEELNICRENNEIIDREIKNARHQLDEVNIQLEQNLENLKAQLNPFPVLAKIKSKIEVDLLQQQKTTAEAFERLQNYQQQLDEIEAQLQQQIDAIEQKRYWWQEYWQTVPQHLRPESEFTDLFELNFLRRFKLQFEVWQQELGVTEAYLNRYQNLISDWVERLKNPSEQNRHELRRIYLDNANVIGITCSQSARGDFSREFESLDVVIIDEVSKCTPPELLIPALKAKKLVLVGDHRQLPPMLNNDTIVEIAKELGSTKEELNYLKESLFKNLFEFASESIKKMLTIQYRMHPQIMGAINQFYEDNLECGLTNPDEQRAHDIANYNIQDNNHIVWIKTTQNQEFREEKDGTSWINRKEIEVIEKICQQFEQTWSVRVNQGQPRKEVGIITFYGRQLKLIESRIDPTRFPSLHVRTGTVDRFQGMERQVIIVSMVRNNERKNVGFAKEPERVNVAFSRAQELLVIIGCHELFTQFPIYSKVSDVIRLYGGLIDVSDIL